MIEAGKTATKMLKQRDYTNAELEALVNDNMEKRSKGALPDVWFWADVELMNRSLV